MAGLDKLCGGWPAKVMREYVQEHSKNPAVVRKSRHPEPLSELPYDGAVTIELLNVQLIALDKARRCLSGVLLHKYPMLNIMPIDWKSQIPPEDTPFSVKKFFNPDVWVDTWVDDVLLWSAGQALGGELPRDITYYQTFQNLMIQKLRQKINLAQNIAIQRMR